MNTMSSLEKASEKDTINDLIDTMLNGDKDRATEIVSEWKQARVKLFKQ